MHKIEKLNEKLLEELGDYSENGKFSKDDTEIIKNLSGAIDHICNIMEDYDDDEYSGRMSYARDGRGGRSYRGGSYRYDDGMMDGEGRSYARDGRGRGSNAKRDSMGRYSSKMDGYSRHGDAVEALREAMESAPDDRTRMEIQRLIEKMEQR